ncbi:uncharacterized protein PpBr36_10693 [Pyricularia pennisetigena]|uniref:uncharacterized protein n=1 Tax=Pyricularia pennisetigena TaxID=1578925 RepID=UPI00114F0ACD|nr:uncharacterized protein PpBr36_10693 [Pyricularia pennisetigena]TLS20938.1 hypothetical protein PpBr36_10693 [Pyricularia pennisetigena]
MHFTSNIGVSAILLSAVAVSAWPVEGASPNSLAARGVGGDVGNIPIKVDGMLESRDVNGAKNSKPAAGLSPASSSAGKKTSGSPPAAAAVVPATQPASAGKGKASAPPAGALTTPQGLSAQQGAGKNTKALAPAAQSSKNTAKPAVGTSGTTATNPAANTACALGKSSKKKGGLARRSDPCWNNPWATNPSPVGGGGGNNAAAGSGLNAWGSSANAWGANAAGGSSTNAWGANAAGGSSANAWGGMGGGGGAAAGGAGGYAAIGGMEVAMGQSTAAYPGQTFKTRGLVNCFGVVVLTRDPTFGATAPALAHVTADATGMQELRSFVQKIRQSGGSATRIVVRQASTSSGMVPSWTAADTTAMLSLRNDVATIMGTLNAPIQAVSSSMGGEQYRNRQPPAGTMWVTGQGQVFVDGQQVL